MTFASPITVDVLPRIYRAFPTRGECVAFLEKLSWPDGPRCAYCGSSRASAMPREHRHHCNRCNTSYSVTTETAFHRSKVELQKWFYAVARVFTAENGVTGRSLSIEISVNKETARYMIARIHRMMCDEPALTYSIVQHVLRAQ